MNILQSDSELCLPLPPLEFKLSSSSCTGEMDIDIGKVIDEWNPLPPAVTPVSFFFALEEEDPQPDPVETPIKIGDARGFVWTKLKNNNECLFIEKFEDNPYDNFILPKKRRKLSPPSSEEIIIISDNNE